ncbi:bifunctional (p)ppGpp synthetase/guanosine-3',5'-bis(diphosphate) 3'-pyrophosphohydrolase [bacterium]|nr:bifunctional (p)ppGpp synthetase/guanosine-3',5'-bis(diphosphate) 3'-pyrophosphohydrolase [bacterium]
MAQELQHIENTQGKISTLEEARARFSMIMETKTNLQPDSPHREKIERAFEFAAEAHEGQTRISGEPYITHPLGVMAILSTLNVDATTLIGALLHDVVEDTGVTVEDVAREFGPVVGVLVEGMTKLSALSYDHRSNEERQAEYFRKMLLSMAQDLRVILIKLADRLHNMRTIDFLPPKTRQRIARETVEIYAPLAHRFGVGKVKWELEDLSLKVLDPIAYRRIAERVAMKREEREEHVLKFIDPLQNRLKQEGMNAKVFGRAKHFYSIYNKIQRRGKSFEEILDLLAVRIIVDDVTSCYRALGIVHGMYTPILERFGDYIATPKANMYQSLHTKVLDREGHVVEVQIRSNEMDLVAEAGIAAHWQYKEKGDQKAANEDPALMEYYNWLRQLIEGSKEEDSSEEFMRTLKINLFTDEVFVFTPRGKLIQLPRGSTPVDFAFAVHTDVGLTTLGAKINGRMVPLSEELHNGDNVEILTSNTSKPNVEWLRFVKTHRARSKIKRFYKRAHFEDSVQLGEDMFKREVQRVKKKPSTKDLLELANRLGHNDIESMWAAIGVGDLQARSVVDKYINLNGKDQSDQVAIKKQKLRVGPTSSSGVRIKGSDNLVTTFGRCCNPLPGDPILGYISKNRGIVVHRTDCPNMSELSKDKDRITEVDWDAGPTDTFPVRLRIVTEDRAHLLRDIAEVLSKQSISALEVNLRTEGTIGIGNLVLMVRSLSHLSKLRSRIGKIKGVVQVERVSVADVV